MLTVNPSTRPTRHNSGCRPRFVDAELDPGGRGKELVGKGLDTVRARLATVRGRLVILNKICEKLKNFSKTEAGVNFTQEIPSNEISENP